MVALAGKDNAFSGREEYSTMNRSNFMQGWLALTESLATIALILTAFGIMLGIVKPADVPKRVGAILGIVIVLMLIPGILVSAWESLSLWQRIGLAMLGVGAWQWLRPRRQTRNKRSD
jgi:Zn-dependent protease with chaperone function